MPNCFQLTRKAALRDGAVALQAIDSELCAAFNEPCDPKEWFHGWYNYIGFLIAMGKTFEWVKAECNKIAGEQPSNDSHLAYWRRMYDIADWLDEHFTADAWAEIGKR